MELDQRYFDRDGKSISIDRWCELLEDGTSQRVLLTKLEGISISTVWLGLNHQYGDGPPLIFETMVFGGGESFDGETDRYSTIDEAVDGHAAMVRRVENAIHLSGEWDE